MRLLVTRIPMRTLIAALGVAVLVTAVPRAGAQTPAEGGVTVILQGTESPERIRRTVEALTRSGTNVVVRLADPETAPIRPLVAGPDLPPRESDGIVEVFSHGLSIGNLGLTRITSAFSDWATKWTAVPNISTAGALALVALILGVAVAAAAAVHRLADRMMPGASPSAPTGRLSARLGIALRRGAKDLLAILAGAMAARAATMILLPQQDLVRSLAEVLAQGVIVVAVYALAGRFLLARDDHGSRVLPLPRAAHHFQMFLTYAVLGQITIAGVSLAALVASDRLAVAGYFYVAGNIVGLFKMWWFWEGRRDFRDLVLAASPDPAKPGQLRRVLAVTTPWFLIITNALIWAAGRIAAAAPDGARWGTAAGVTSILLILIPILAGGATALVRDTAMPDAGSGSPLARALAAVTEKTLGALIWISGLYVLAQLWGVFLIATESSAAVAIVWQFVTIVAILFATSIIWTFLRVLFDAYAPQRGSTAPGEEDDGEPTVQSRLRTVLPVIRGVVLGTVAALAVLICLSRLGIDIGPLLAGFGILGLAISFGSQALVRDIVSGIFFIAEDAFRVGEYIDTGRLKGTVEKISIRSVQLRHQSGQIHTVPFGQLQSVTNASRDWATVKFNLRLERDANIELARKTIKKIGQAMQVDPEFAAEFIQPLKLQGMAEVTDSALVIRLKFTAKPTRTSWLQREALKRVYAGLTAAGVSFASNAVTVRGHDDRAAEAAGAASITSAPVAT